MAERRTRYKAPRVFDRRKVTRCYGVMSDGKNTPYPPARLRPPAPEEGAQTLNPKLNNVSHETFSR